MTANEMEKVLVSICTDDFDSEIDRLVNRIKTEDPHFEKFWHIELDLDKTDANFCEYKNSVMKRMIGDVATYRFLVLPKLPNIMYNIIRGDVSNEKEQTN